MSTEIGANKGAFLGRVILQVALFAGLCYLIYVIMFPKGTHLYHEQKVRDWLFGLGCLVANVVLFFRLYFLVSGVIMDDQLKMLEIKYWFLPSQTIRLTDIAGYSDTVIKGRSSSYQGIYIHLNEGKKILLSDLNLTDSFPVEMFLGDCGVKKMPDE